MMKSSVLMVFLLVVMCSVWTGHGRSFDVDTHDVDQVDEVSLQVRTLPGLCKICKWTLNKVKKRIGPDANAEEIKSKLLNVCDKISFLKSLCQKFVNGRLGKLIEELTTTDDVRTICVNIKTCKPKEKTDQLVL